VVALAARSKESKTKAPVEPNRHSFIINHREITLFKNQADKRSKVKLHLSSRKLATLVWLSVYSISCAHHYKTSTSAHGSNHSKPVVAQDQTTDPSTLLKASITSQMMMKSQSNSNLVGHSNFHRPLINLNNRILILMASQEPTSAIKQLLRREDNKKIKDKLTKMSYKESSRHLPKMMMKL